MNVELARGGVIKVGIVPNSQSKSVGFGCDGKIVKTGFGRFPANVITDGSEEVASGMPQGSITGHRTQESIKKCIESRKLKKGNSQCDVGGDIDHITEYTDSGSVMRYFYQAKASKKDRDNGLELFESIQVNDGRKTEIDNAFQRGETLRKNIHPTVKPVELMQYLVRLVSPKGATIMDIFNGSGSTGKAVAFENRERDAKYKYIGIELSEDYCKISQARIDYGLNKFEYDMIKDIKEEEQKTGQMSLFDFGGSNNE